MEFKSAANTQTLSAPIPLSISPTFFRGLQNFDKYRKRKLSDLVTRKVNLEGNLIALKDDSPAKQNLQWEKEIGVGIYNQFIPIDSEIRAIVEQFLNWLQKRKIANLTFVISSSLPKILNIPFEMMRTDVSSSPLSIYYDNLLICRSLEESLAEFEVRPSDTLPPPLRVLFITSLPTNLSESQKYIDLEKEQEWLIQALGNLPAKGKVLIEFLEVGSLNEIELALEEGKYHIVHMSTHALFRDEQWLEERLTKEIKSTGLLQLETDTGKLHYVSSREITSIINKYSSIKLVLLSACETARAEELGIIGSLIHAGVPCVIGMRYPISDSMASLFTSKLYKYLCQGESIHRSLFSARQAIQNKEAKAFSQTNSRFKISEWFTPFLYLNQYMEALVDFQKPTRNSDYFSQQPLTYIAKGVKGPHRKFTSAKMVGRGFIGRRKQLAKLNRLFKTKQAQTICIHGMGGIGKTSLAVRFAENFDNRSHQVIEFVGSIVEYDILNKVVERISNPQIQERLRFIVNDKDLDSEEKLNFLLRQYVRHFGLKSKKVIITGKQRRTLRFYHKSKNNLLCCQPYLKSCWVT